MVEVNNNPDKPTLPIKRKLYENKQNPSPQNDEKQQANEEEKQEEVNDKELIDRKGKGILIEDDQQDDIDNVDSDSDSDSGIGDGLSDESDLEDDPLAEVELDNILPSRTRRKTSHPGVIISSSGIPQEDFVDSDDDPYDA